MQKWSDSFLNSVNDWSQLLGLVALFLTFVFGYLAYATAKEDARRSAERENASEERANRLQKTADEAIKRAKDLEISQLPRQITSEQKDIFKAFTAQLPKGKVSVCAVLNDRETYDFALSLRDLFAYSGFEVDPIVGQALMSGPPVLGIRVSNANQSHPPEYLWSIVDGLKSINIASMPITDPGVKYGVAVYVGGKPK